MTETITLGGREFELRPLKLGQLRHVLDALDSMNGRSGGTLIAAAAGIVAAGLAPAHPDITAEAVLDLEAGIEELNAAVAAVLRVAWLQPQGGVTGESQPVAAAEQGNSAGSTPPSPPDAGTATATSTR